MIVVIQCAAKKAANAGLMQSADGKPVFLVADPSLAPSQAGMQYARPDDLDAGGVSWRKKLFDYNCNPGNNPLGLLPAWELYAHPAYRMLHDRFGSKNLYILSAGWGLIAADFLTPMYDITFSNVKAKDKYKRRYKRDDYADLQMLPNRTKEPVVFLGGKDYIDLFCRLTADVKGGRTVFYNSGIVPPAPNCTLQRFVTTTRTNWHYECAKTLVARA